jgi:hypothetical protein
MPIVSFKEMPSDARVWVFGADRRVEGDAERRLLEEVDSFLESWKAHGDPLTVARDWREQRFLVIAVDQRDANASGCSIDGLFRDLQRLEREIGARVVGSGRVFWRDADGTVHAAERSELKSRIAAGEITSSSRMFDLSATTLADLERNFEKPAEESWAAASLARV